MSVTIDYNDRGQHKSVRFRFIRERIKAIHAFTKLYPRAIILKVRS